MTMILIKTNNKNHQPAKS